MTRERLDGLYLVLLGAIVFILVGSALEYAAPVSAADFRVMYYSTRCFLSHCDSYNVDELTKFYHDNGGEVAAETQTIRLTETQYIYAPSAFSIVAPFAMLPFQSAHLAWLALTAAAFIVAAFLIWDIAARHDPVLSGMLVCLLLANSELLLILGNPAGLAISCCVIAVVCLLQQRLIFVGILCLAISLMLKPHDSGLVWLYFLLSGRVNRKRALQVVAVAALLSAPSILWISHTAPVWIQEMSANLAANGALGGLSDPGPNSMAAHGIGMLISLQSVFSLIRDEPGFYNPASYIVCGVLLLVWLFKTVRSKFTTTNAWFSLALIALLTMLPIYHRIYDARLMLLVVPACAMLWAEGGVHAWLAAILSASSAIITGGIPWAIFLAVIKKVRLPGLLGTNESLLILQVAPVPLVLLVSGCFFLWVYLKRKDEPAL